MKFHRVLKREIVQGVVKEEFKKLGFLLKRGEKKGVKV